MKFAKVMITALMLTTPVAASSLSPTDIKIPIPNGYQALCQAQPIECTSTGSSMIELESETMKTLIRINNTVNRSITYRTEAGDTWSVNPTFFGDCEDYALTKRNLLKAAGFSSAALRIGIVQVRGVTHAILIVRTTEGDYVLDNLNNQVKLWSDTEFYWLGIEESSDRWVLL